MANDRAHFLLVGDDGDVAMIQATLKRLPVDAYGQVYFEVDDALQVRPIEAPRGMMITWLLRDRLLAQGVRATEPGLLAAAAIEGWLGEWMPEGQAANDPLVLWVGCTASAHVDRLYWDLRARLPQLHLHHPHYDNLH